MHVHPVISEELAIEIAGFGLVGGPSEIGTLRKVTELAARAIAGCVGATAAQWIRGDEPEPLLWAATHPDLSELSEIQRADRSGPAYDAVRTGAAQSCADTLVEARWPGLSAAMVQRGVRSFTTSVHHNGTMAITLTAYGTMPDALGGREGAVAALLIGQGSAAVSNARSYDQAHRTARQLQEAVESRAVVDQAKGIIMHALGCSADEAFAELKRISQTSHTKLTAIARRVVSGERS